MTAQSVSIAPSWGWCQSLFVPILIIFENKNHLSADSVSTEDKSHCSTDAALLMMRISQYCTLLRTGITQGTATSYSWRRGWGYALIKTTKHYLCCSGYGHQLSAENVNVRITQAPILIVIEDKIHSVSQISLNCGCWIPCRLLCLSS